MNYPQKIGRHPGTDWFLDKISNYSKDSFARECENPPNSPWNLMWLVATRPGAVSSPTMLLS